MIHLSSVLGRFLWNWLSFWNRYMDFLFCWHVKWEGLLLCLFMARYKFSWVCWWSDQIYLGFVCGVIFCHFPFTVGDTFSFSILHIQAFTRISRQSWVSVIFEWLSLHIHCMVTDPLAQLCVCSVYLFYFYQNTQKPTFSLSSWQRSVLVKWGG